MRLPGFVRDEDIGLGDIIQRATSLHRHSNLRRMQATADRTESLVEFQRQATGVGSEVGVYLLDPRVAMAGGLLHIFERGAVLNSP